MLELCEPFRFEPLSVSTMLEIQRKVTNEYGMPKEYITVKMHQTPKITLVYWSGEFERRMVTFDINGIYQETMQSI